jgi:8-oxo-dGTP pyrophosphatase MutT (NUDIX family)
VILPNYCCAIIEDQHGWLLLQLRPANARFAPGQLTCFGGRREDGEDPLACIRRELHEELGWCPQELFRRVDLVGHGGRMIAWFYQACLPAGTKLLPETDHAFVLAPWPALPALPLSNWHRESLAALRMGLRCAISLDAE